MTIRFDPRPTADQFAALADIARMDTLAPRTACRLVAVDGLRPSEAADQVGIGRQTLRNALARLAEALLLAQRLAGGKVKRPQAPLAPEHFNDLAQLARLRGDLLRGEKAAAYHVLVQGLAPAEAARLADTSAITAAHAAQCTLVAWDLAASAIPPADASAGTSRRVQTHQ